MGKRKKHYQEEKFGKLTKLKNYQIKFTFPMQINQNK